MYKTISYPSSESGTAKIERLRIAFEGETDTEFLSWIEQLESKDLRYILSDTYSNIQEKAVRNEQYLSDLAVKELKSHFQKLQIITSRKSVEQTSLFESEVKQLGSHGTFTPNKVESIHRWYPYIEGFSSTFVESLIDKWASGAKTIYDPFAGTGTAMTVAALGRITGYFSEVNPFMKLVIEAKTNVLKRLSDSKPELSEYLYKILDYAKDNRPSQIDAERILEEVFPGKPYFVGNRLIDIVALKQSIEINKPDNEDFILIAKLCLGSIGVPSSETKRSSDLRYRTPKELLDDSYQVFEIFEKKIAQVLSDIDEKLGSISNTIFASDNAVNENIYEDTIDLVITSPPYLNGTNYFRNTKIELWLAGFITHESDLSYFTREAMIAGINNVSKSSRPIKKFSFVEPVAKQLDDVAYDKRIPTLVRGYCSDTELWLKSCKKMMKNNAKIVIDIGDSRFAGVYVPTDEFIIKIAEKIGLKLIDVELVRKRTSKDGTALKQVLLTFEKTKSAKNNKNPSNASRSITKEVYKAEAVRFGKELPYKTAPYDSRNWGHPLHSLCSYQGKLKPAIAHFLVTNFSSEGDTVLDPLSGAGTIPLEAFLNGRKAIANDLQELGYILSSAKVAKPSPDKVIKELEKFLKYVSTNSRSVDLKNYPDVGFGLNGKIGEYYHQENLKEILVARKYIVENKCNSVERAIVYSAFLHILHGNRPYALSRKSHPVTPFKPSGDFVHKDLSERLYSKVKRALESYENNATIDGEAILGSYEKLPFQNSVDLVITSPPFAASTRFYIANWLRLWSSGWEASDFKDKKFEFLEEKQKKDLNIYDDFFKNAHKWLKPDGKLILHLGKTQKFNMAEELSKISEKYFETVHLFDEDVAGAEKFGIRDQGATVAHQFLFLLKKA